MRRCFGVSVICGPHDNFSVTIGKREKIHHTVTLHPLLTHNKVYGGQVNIPKKMTLI